MHDSIINSASQLNDLGVIIDSKLNWIPHITYVKNKISKGIGIMFKARDYLNKKCCIINDVVNIIIIKTINIQIV